MFPLFQQKLEISVIFLQIMNLRYFRFPLFWPSMHLRIALYTYSTRRLWSGCKHTSSIWTLTQTFVPVLFLVRLCLNRQAMLLLSGLGVPDDSFFRLQDRMLTNMANILIDENAAVEVITKVCAYFSATVWVVVYRGVNLVWKLEVSWVQVWKLGVSWVVKSQHKLQKDKYW